MKSVHENEMRKVNGGGLLAAGAIVAGGTLATHIYWEVFARPQLCKNLGWFCKK